MSYLIITFRKPSDPLIKSKVEVTDDDGEKSDNEEEGKDEGKWMKADQMWEDILTKNVSILYYIRLNSFFK